MMSLKEQATIMLQSLPDEKMPYVVDMLKWVTDILAVNSERATAAVQDNSSEAVEAWERFKAYKCIIPYDINAKAELAKARDEKYANFI